MLKNKVVIYLYSRYERLWHWLQGLLIIVLLLTGFEIHEGFTLFGFHQAVNVHNFVGLTWLIAFAFFVFWIFTTGEWKQYIPTTRKMLAVAHYYAYGIFRGQAHPVPKRKEAKHNPLQRLTYLSLAAFLLPFQMITGLLYWGYNAWPAWGVGSLSLPVLAVLHTHRRLTVDRFHIEGNVARCGPQVGRVFIGHEQELVGVPAPAGPLPVGAMFDPVAEREYT